MQRSGSGRQRRGMWLPMSGAALDIDFTRGRAYGTSLSALTATRAGGASSPRLSADGLQIDNDVVTLPIGAWFNALAGTWFVEYSKTSVSGFPALLSADGAGDRHTLFMYAAGGDHRYVALVGGVGQCDISGGAYSLVNRNKIAGAYALNDFAVSGNGGAVATDIAGNLPTPTVLCFGSQNGTDFLGGFVRRAAYFPVRLSNTELQRITA